MGRSEAGRLAAEQLGQQLLRSRPGRSTTCTGQYYLHNFLPEQADLNWWNDEVRDEFDRIFRFWFDRGVAGFRIDVAHMIVKDAELRDNPPATADDPILDADARPAARLQREPARGARRPSPAAGAIADSYDPPRLLVGETFLPTIDDVIPFYGNGDELQPRVQLPVHAAAARSRARCEPSSSRPRS